VDPSEAFTYSPPVTALKLAARKVIYGHEQVLNLSVTVSPQYSGSTPTGTVTVKESTTTLCVITLSSGKGSCTLSAKKLPVRTYRLVATYGGSTDFAGSASAKETLTVAKAVSRTALNLSARKVIYGHEQVLNLSVTVSPQYSGSTPTGTVTVKQSTTTLCVISLSSAKRSCRLSAKKLKAGTYRLVATYGGSTNFKGSTSAKETLCGARPPGSPCEGSRGPCTSSSCSGYSRRRLSMESSQTTRKSFTGFPSWPITAGREVLPAVARRRQVLGLFTRASTWRTTDADGTLARRPHRLLVSLRVPTEHVGSD
jgi:hypothetical protein